MLSFCHCKNSISLLVSVLFNLNTFNFSCFPWGYSISVAMHRWGAGKGFSIASKGVHLSYFFSSSLPSIPTSLAPIPLPTAPKPSVLTFAPLSAKFDGRDTCSMQPATYPSFSNFSEIIGVLFNFVFCSVC